MNVVVDASVAIKWCVPEDNTSDAEQLLDPRFKLHAPDLLLPEFANILWKKCRQNDLDIRDAEMALKLFRRQSITIHPHDDVLTTAFLGAYETKQAVYDWIYLALALSLSCPLITADRKFLIALRKTRFSKELIWIENAPNLI